YLFSFLIIFSLISFRAYSTFITSFNSLSYAILQSYSALFALYPFTFFRILLLLLVLHFSFNLFFFRIFYFFYFFFFLYFSFIFYIIILISHTLFSFTFFIFFFFHFYFIMPKYAKKQAKSQAVFAGIIARTSQRQTQAPHVQATASNS